MDQNEHPAASRRGFLRSGGMAALFGVAAAPVAGAASVTLAVSPELWSPTISKTTGSRAFCASRPACRLKRRSERWIGQK